MSTPALDLALLEELRSILSDDGLREIVELYLDEAPRSIGALEQALGAADAFRVRATAHRLKGSAMGVGALEVTTLARAFEVAAEAGRLATLEQDLPALRAAAARAAAALHGLLR